jgi:ABC-type glycerol-3-phosphate transport system substrate-binding protein
MDAPGKSMKTSMILTASALILSGCGGIATNTAAKSADGLNWPACIEWNEALESDGKSVKTGLLVCAADENELNAVTPKIRAAFADKHPKIEFHTVPLQ